MWNHSNVFTYQWDVQLLIQPNLMLRRSISDSFVWKVNDDKSVLHRISRCYVTCKFIGKICRKIQMSVRNAICYCCYSTNLFFTHLRQSKCRPLYVKCWFYDRSFNSNSLLALSFSQDVACENYSQRERYRVVTNASRFHKFRKVKALEKIGAVRNSAYILRTLHGWEGILYLPAAMNNYSTIHDPLQYNVT